VTHLVVIEVRGGLVQTVYTDDPNLRVVIHDYDVAEAGDNPIFGFPTDPLIDLDDAIKDNVFAEAEREETDEQEG
jgi:hypothetical protein